MLRMHSLWWTIQIYQMYEFKISLVYEQDECDDGRVTVIIGGGGAMIFLFPFPLRAIMTSVAQWKERRILNPGKSLPGCRNIATEMIQINYHSLHASLFYMFLFPPTKDRKCHAKKSAWQQDNLVRQWLNAGSVSLTLTRHWASAGPASRVRRWAHGTKAGVVCQYIT